MPEETEGVNSTEESPSSESQFAEMMPNAEPVNPQSPPTLNEAAATLPESVPYGRFSEINTKFRESEDRLKTELEPYAPFLADLKAAGLNNAEDVRAYLTQQQTAQRFQDQVQSGQMDPSVADALYRAETAAQMLQGREQQIAQYQMDTALSAMKTQYPEMNEAMVRRYAKNPQEAQALAKESHDDRSATRLAAVADYNAKKATQSKTLPPEGAQSGVPGPGSLSDAAFMTWFDEQEKAGQRRRAGYS